MRHNPPAIAACAAVTFAALPLAGLWGQAATQTEAADRADVLFLAVDDMRDWVACLGGYRGNVLTPNIDRLASRGMLFSNAHCASPKCAPSRAAIMTGQRPSTTGLYDNGHWWLPNLPHAVTIPAMFRQHGYRVVGAGKLFHHTAGNNPPNQWDDFLRLTFRNDPWFRGDRLNYPWSSPAPFPARYPLSRVRGLGHENDWGSLGIDDASYDDSLTADYAIDFLGREHDQPYFLACGFFRPHLPWYVPQKYFDLYPIDEVLVPETTSDDLDDLPAEALKLAAARRNDFETIKKAGRWKHAVQAYLASISYADAQIGRVLDALDARPSHHRTIIMMWSDHGWHLGEKEHWHKSTLWEAATRVPLIISAPEHRRGVCDQPVSLLDLYPTLCELCRMQPTPDNRHRLDGVSLAPLLRDPETPWDRPAVIEYKFGNAAVRGRRYRYIRYRDGGEELYDHDSDSEEWTNLADDPQFARVKQALAKSITRRWAEPAATKRAFRFDPQQYTWTHRESGTKTMGK